LAEAQWSVVREKAREWLTANFTKEERAGIKQSSRASVEETKRARERALAEADELLDIVAQEYLELGLSKEEIITTLHARITKDKS
jgi:DNA-binding transcriptional regulator YhcF (GntR family)